MSLQERWCVFCEQWEKEGEPIYQYDKDGYEGWAHLSCIDEALIKGPIDDELATITNDLKWCYPNWATRLDCPIYKRYLDGYNPDELYVWVAVDHVHINYKKG